MRKLLVTGSSGMLGGNIISELGSSYEIYGLDKTVPDSLRENQFEIDMTDPARLAELINKIAPDLVVHCAAMTNVDQCEKDYFRAYETNAVATKYLLSAVGSTTRFIYISTDSVFDGNRGGYCENDTPSPLNNYAKTKLEGEWFVEQRSANYAIIRTNIFGWNLVRGCSFAEWIFTSLSKGEQIKMFTDVIFSPVSVYTLSCFIDKLLNSDFSGRLNIGTKDSISKYDFGVRLAKLFDLDASLIAPTSIDEFDFTAQRPKNSSLNVSRAEQMFGWAPKVEDELAVFCKRKLKSYEKCC